VQFNTHRNLIRLEEDGGHCLSDGSVGEAIDCFPFFSGFQHSSAEIFQVYYETSSPESDNKEVLFVAE